MSPLFGNKGFGRGGGPGSFRAESGLFLDTCSFIMQSGRVSMGAGAVEERGGKKGSAWFPLVSPSAEVGGGAGTLQEVLLWASTASGSYPPWPGPSMEGVGLFAVSGVSPASAGPFQPPRPHQVTLWSF